MSQRLGHIVQAWQRLRTSISVFELDGTNLTNRTWGRRILLEHFKLSLFLYRWVCSRCEDIISLTKRLFRNKVPRLKRVFCKIEAAIVRGGWEKYSELTVKCHVETSVKLTSNVIGHVSGMCNAAFIHSAATSEQYRLSTAKRICHVLREQWLSYCWINSIDVSDIMTGMRIAINSAIVVHKGVWVSRFNGCISVDASRDAFALKLPIWCWNSTFRSRTCHEINTNFSIDYLYMCLFNFYRRK